jgi:hypothetical protein
MVRYRYLQSEVSGELFTLASPERQISSEYGRGKGEEILFKRR